VAAVRSGPITYGEVLREICDSLSCPRSRAVPVDSALVAISPTAWSIPLPERSTSSINSRPVVHKKMEGTRDLAAPATA
jgi:hypothetical protein